MKTILKIIIVFIASSIILLGQSSSLDIKLGILVFSNNSISTAKNYEKIKSKDKFQVIIQCKKNYYLYIINYNENNAKIMYHNLISSNEFMELPAKNEYYSFDGLFEYEYLSIIIFKERNIFLEELFSNNSLEFNIWEKHEKNLIDKSLFRFIGPYDFNEGIAGNIRGNNKIKLLEFNFNNHFIIKYTFYVKK